MTHNYQLILGNAFQWMEERTPGTITGIVTDPPYGIVEFDHQHLEKMKAGKGGIWRIPPSFDGAKRQPLPRFTALDENERTRVAEFFREFGRLCVRVLAPGGHVLLAGNSFLASLVFSALVEGGLEFRGQIIRKVITLRGGDRPKNAEEEFPDVCSLPKGHYEPWGLFRAPLPKKMTVAEALRTYGTGGLRRLPDGLPFPDLLESGRTAKNEKVGHPSQKPMDLMIQLVRAILPLGKGVVLDPFAGTGTTLAAAEINGYSSIGIELNPEYYAIAQKAIPRLIAQAQPNLLLQFLPEHDRSNSGSS